LPSPWRSRRSPPGAFAVDASIPHLLSAGTSRGIFYFAVAVDLVTVATVSRTLLRLANDNDLRAT
jgi:hypothetical protein